MKIECPCGGSIEFDPVDREQLAIYAEFNDTHSYCTSQAAWNIKNKRETIEDWIPNPLDRAKLYRPITFPEDRDKEAEKNKRWFRTYTKDGLIKWEVMKERE